MVIIEGNPRQLIIGELVIEGGDNKGGIYASSNQLYFDGALIPTTTLHRSGLVQHEGNVYFNGYKIGSEEIPVLEYWNPPTQPASVLKPWTYEELIQEYDNLMASNSSYITKRTYVDENDNPILTLNGSYELYSYVLEPENYTKTAFIQAGIHGNEMDSKQQLLRFVDILCNKTHLPEYSQLKQLRDNVRFVIIPCVSPYGHDNSAMNVPYADAQYGLNMNRNYDYNHQYALASTGVGGNTFFEYVEVQHTKSIIEEFGAENIDFAQDWHDGGNVSEHYWINYAVDSYTREGMMNFINYLIDKYEIENPVIPNCKDTGTTGTTQGWLGKTMGINANTVEWIGGYLGYDFGTEHMTQSLEIRVNSILIAYKTTRKGWKVYENTEQPYFKFDYPKSFTRDGLRMEGASAETKVSDAKIYARWNALQYANPSYITKTIVGTDVTATQEVATYTLGNGTNKVLYVGGIMRYGGSHKIDEYAMYMIAEYLCNDSIVSQSRFLQDLKNNYTIIVLPCIDNQAVNNATYRTAGLNNQALSYKKWRIVNDKTEPTTNALTYNDLPIIKSLIDNNQDLKCIVSGGEIMTGYSGNTADYPTEYETQFVIPRNMSASTITTYINYLENILNEDVDVSNTIGFTFGDYAYDQYEIPTYFIQQNVSKRYTELSEYHTLTEQQYLHQNYEAGRRMSVIINTFLI